MTVDQVLKHFGTRREAAYKLNYTENAIRVWEKNGRIPQRAQTLIEKVTRGGLRAEPAK